VEFVVVMADDCEEELLLVYYLYILHRQSLINADSFPPYIPISSIYFPRVCSSPSIDLNIQPVTMNSLEHEWLFNLVAII
jgi:hypothetical protein